MVWCVVCGCATVSVPVASASAEHQTEQLAVVRQLMEKMAERASSLLQALQLTDVTQSGLVSTAVKLCWIASQLILSL